MLWQLLSCSSWAHSIMLFLGLLMYTLPRPSEMKMQPPMDTEAGLLLAPMFLSKCVGGVVSNDKRLNTCAQAHASFMHPFQPCHCKQPRTQHARTPSTHMPVSR